MCLAQQLSLLPQPSNRPGGRIGRHWAAGAARGHQGGLAPHGPRVRQRKGQYPTIPSAGPWPDRGGATIGHRAHRPGPLCAAGATRKPSAQVGRTLSERKAGAITCLTQPMQRGTVRKNVQFLTGSLLEFWRVFWEKWALRAFLFFKF